MGARVRLLPSGGPFLGANYLINFGGANVAHFVRGNLGYEYVASGGFTILASVGGFAVIRDFKDSGNDKLGFLVRIGLGYSF